MTNQLLVQNAELAINQLKNEIAAEMGIELGANTTAHDNGRVGAEMTKRLVALGEQYLAEQSINNSTLAQSNKCQTSHHELH